MESENSHDEIKRLIQENTALLKENNKILRKVYRNEIIGIWVKVIWFLLLIGLPFLLYFYVLEPYFTAVGSSYETFSEGMQEIPGWKHLIQFMEAIKNAE
jgi:hypothetical protein